MTFSELFATNLLLQSFKERYVLPPAADTFFSKWTAKLQSIFYCANFFRKKIQKDIHNPWKHLAKPLLASVCAISLKKNFFPDQ